MAIAIDVGTGSANQTGSSVTFSHTCTGSNLALVVGVTMATATNRTVSSITYNSVGLTQIATIDETANQNRRTDLWYLLAPSTGANNIIVTLSGAPDSFFNVGAASYTGVKQSGQPDAFGTATSGASLVTAINKSITTIANNCWMVGVACNSAGLNPTADSGTTFRNSIYNRLGNGFELFSLDSNGAESPAGSYSQGLTFSSARANIIVASLAPAVAVSTNSSFFDFM